MDKKEKSWFRRHWILTTVLGLFISIIAIGIFQGISENEKDSQNITFSGIEKFNKNDLKAEIEEITFSTSYIPKVSVLTLQNNILFLEYFSYENENAGIFNEQQKVSEKIVSYFENNEIGTPHEVLFKTNGITNEYTTTYPVFYIKLDWNSVIKMANLELEYSFWVEDINNTKQSKI